MIDTIKIVSMINKELYNIIHSQSIVKTSYDTATGEIFYKIINNSLEGSYNSSLSVRIGEGAKYNFVNMYYIEIEGSYHKLVRGYNSHNRFYKSYTYFTRTNKNGRKCLRYKITFYTTLVFAKN